jgi:hypothetical protein
MTGLRPSRVDDSVYVYDISAVDRIFSADFSYRKAAWVLHMLRHVLGDEAFFTLLHRWRDTYAFSSATTADFRALAEAVAGRDLGFFFDEWVYRPGAPVYRMGWQGHRVAGRDLVEIYLEQSQRADFPVFTMPVDVLLTSGDGSLIRRVQNDARLQHLLLAVPSPVDSLELDPDGFILRTGLHNVAFVAGPPKVVATAPDPGTRLARSGATALKVTFHKDVVITPSDVSLFGVRSGEVALSLTYDASTLTATLLPSAPLGSDAYTLTVRDTVRDLESLQRLDGEVAGGGGPATLPSGDGQPGGNAVIHFTVTEGPRRHLHAGS